MKIVTCLLSWLAIARVYDAATVLPSQVKVIGEGYNVVYGNTDGGQWQSGGVDPGIRVARKIFNIEKDQDFQTEVTYDHHDNCQSSHTSHFWYSPYSYQQKLSQRIIYDGQQYQSLTGAAFSLSNPYHDAKAETTQHHHVINDKETTCVTGIARYKTSLVQADQYRLTTEVLVDVCSLPETYDAQAYTAFIDRWGTHVITEVHLGHRETDRYLMNASDFVSYVMNKSPSDVSMGGPSMTSDGSMMDSDSSYIIDTNSFKSSLGFSDNIGQLYDTLKTGTDSSPEPIALGLTSIDMILSPIFWQDEHGPFYDYCPFNITASVSILRQNMIKALQDYATVKQGETPLAVQFSIPVTWPSGTYGLPKPISGCRDQSALWQEGWIKQNTETQTPDSKWSSPNHLAGSLSKTLYNLYFCMKTVYTNGLSLDWPKGDYCIFKYHTCPKGFTEGFVKWDDEDTNNANAHGGTRPDGEYGADTLMRYCCRSDASIYDPIILPSEKPFYLFKYKHGCQEVKDMTVTEEFLLWDDQDDSTTTKAAIGSVHPGMRFCNPPKYPGCGTGSTIYYCYYKKRDDGISNIIG